MQQGVLRTGDARVAWTALLDTEWRMKAKVSNARVRYSKPMDLTLQNSSRSNGLIAKKNISYPSTNLWNPKLKAEINGIVASRCVWRPPSPHEIISCLHMMSISTSCSSHVPFERSGHTWTKFHTRSNHQCNLWKRKKMPVSHKLSEASRLNSLFCLCLIPKLSKSMAQPHCCCRLKQAEINGIVASRCVWRPRSPHEIISCLHMMSISTSCSSHVPFERSGHTWILNQIPNSVQLSVQPMKAERNAGLHISYLKRQDWTACSVSVWFPSSPNQWRNRTVAAGWHRPR